jgi:Zn-dependent protease with chaperone function
MAERIVFPGITAAAFTSDSDRWALDKLQKVPLLPVVIKKFHELGLDRWMYVHNLGVSVRCGPNQFPTLYNILKDCCKILDMPEPELYVSNNPFPNAFAGGIERPYITLHSSIINTMNDEELYYLIGHELGHIKCDHILYFLVYWFLWLILEFMGMSFTPAGSAVSYALVLAFYEWSRQAEFSADRAGMLCSQSRDNCIDAIVKLTAGPSRLENEVDREAFMDQARAYQDLDFRDQMGKALLFLLIRKEYTHPLPVHRAQALELWYQGGDFTRILNGEYPRAKAAS